MSSKHRKPLRENVAVITGASSGIGAAIALRLGREGMTLVLTARREERLREVAAEAGKNGARTLVIPADLSQPTERVRMLAEAEAHFGQVDILINNAGFGWYGYYSRMPWQIAVEMMRVNMEAAAHLSHLALPSMLARQQGHILMIGSIAGDVPSQGIALYSASKGFLDTLSTALQRECAGSGVWVSNIKPGPVHSEFFPNVRNAEGSRHIPVEQFAVPANRVAEKAWRTLQRPRRRAYVPGIFALAPWVELSLGWLMDRIGPLLLRRTDQPNSDTGSGSRDDATGDGG
ncbi:MAG: SDR family NAD(P)-dependent oxidoreductase [Anaerolineae bacterium]|nr:SDR family NAD(P)-dependent oxidoreductase [Anaerolineae bacterium]